MPRDKVQVTLMQGAEHDHDLMGEYAEDHSSLRGEPESDQRDEMFAVFEKRLASTPKDGSKALGLLKAVKNWQDKSVRSGNYGPWTTYSGLPAWKRPFEYSCVLGAADALVNQHNVALNAATLTWLTPYLGDALLAVSLEGWFKPQFRVLGLGEFARRIAAGVVDPIHAADEKKSTRFAKRVEKAKAEGRHGTKREHRPGRTSGRAFAEAFTGVGAADDNDPDEVGGIHRKKPSAKDLDDLRNPRATPLQLSKWLNRSQAYPEGYRYDGLNALEQNPNLEALLAADTSPQSPLLKSYYEARFWRAVEGIEAQAKAITYQEWVAWAYALTQRVLPIYEQKFPRDKSFATALEVLRRYLMGQASLEELETARTATRKGKRRPSQTERRVTFVTANAARYALGAALSVATYGNINPEPTWFLVRDFTNAIALAEKTTKHIGTGRDDPWTAWKSRADAAEWALTQIYK